MAWRPGYTPREHEELLDRKAAQAREDRRDREARKWQEQVVADQRAFQQRLADQARQERRALMWVAGGFTLFGASLPVIAALLVAG